MKTLVFTAGTIALGLGIGAAALAAPAGTLLFTQPGSSIVDERGATRPAKQGDILQTGERLLTLPGAISQVLLPDGSLVGLRPGSELRFDTPGPNLDKLALVSLLQGAARVIGSELMHVNKPSAFTFQSGPATLKLQGADLETALIRPDANKPSGGNDPGSYNRLLIGVGSIGTGTQVEPLALRQVSFVSTVNVAPVTLASVSPSIFAPALALNTSALGAKTLPSADPSPVSGAKLAPSLTTSTLTTPIISSIVVQPGTQPTSPTLLSPVTTTTLALQSPTVTASPATPAPAATPVTLTIPVVAVIQPTAIVTPPPAKLPVVSCKILRTC